MLNIYNVTLLSIKMSTAETKLNLTERNMNKTLKHYVLSEHQQQWWLVN